MKLIRITKKCIQRQQIRLMTYTAHTSKEQLEEHFEPKIELEKKAFRIAQLIKRSKHCIVFTGAGISTSAGIPDFRGPEGNHSLYTSLLFKGVWTLKDQGRMRTKPTVSTLCAIPTKTHMSIVKLIQTEKVKYLVSQNTDGLHRRSGVPAEKISELHGNSNREVCEDCGKEYLRDFSAVASYRKSVHDHYTGRRCVKCNGKLKDTIINFGEPLPQKQLELAFEHAERADFCLYLV